MLVLPGRGLNWDGEAWGGPTALYLMLKAALGAEDGFPVLHYTNQVKKTSSNLSVTGHTTRISHVPGVTAIPILTDSWMGGGGALIGPPLSHARAQDSGFFLERHQGRRTKERRPQGLESTSLFQPM